MWLAPRDMSDLEPSRIDCEIECIVGDVRAFVFAQFVDVRTIVTNRVSEESRGKIRVVLIGFMVAKMRGAIGLYPRPAEVTFEEINPMSHESIYAYEG